MVVCVVLRVMSSALETVNTQCVVEYLNRLCRNYRGNVFLQDFQIEKHSILDERFLDTGSKV